MFPVLPSSLNTSYSERGAVLYQDAIPGIIIIYLHTTLAESLIVEIHEVEL